MHSKVLKVPDLVVGSAAGRVGYHPRGLFFRFVRVFAQDIYQHGEYVIVYDGLDLLAVSRRDVAHRPARLFSHVISWPADELPQVREDSAVDDHLGLGVVTGHDVSDGSERRRHDADFRKTET